MVISEDIALRSIDDNAGPRAFELTLTLPPVAGSDERTDLELTDC